MRIVNVALLMLVVTMIKYYSTLTNTFHKSEESAQKAEDQYVEQYFKDIEERAAAKRRKLRNLSNDTNSINIKID